jgi:4-hydroxy-4-methyl-2-oxoglutarate aldolase
MTRSELLALGSATLYEASKLPCFLPTRLRPAWKGAAIVGRALPVRTAVGDNLPMHRVLQIAEPGDVLVIDAGAGEFGYWGEVLTVAAQQRGVVGLIIDGGVRDVAQLEELAFPVFSSSIALQGTVKVWPGTVGEPIELGGVTVNRGDLVVADVDGIVAIPSDDVDRVVEASRGRARDEQGYLERLRAGELTLDIYGFRSLLSGDDAAPMPSLVE